MLDRISINDCEWSVRTGNRLQASRYKTLADLDQASDLDLLAIRGFGPKCVREVRELIRNVGQRNPDNDICEWALAHQNLIRALMNGEAEIRVRDA